MTAKRGPVFLARLVRIATTLGHIEKADPDRDAELLTDQELADSAALIQDVRRRLADVELALVGAIGKRHGNKTVGNLSDGRQFTVSRSGDRTSWDHEDWKRDVRRVIVGGLPAAVVVDTDTGEERPLAKVLQEVLAKAQEVHGSTGPRTTQLKALGLYAGDYSTTTPGPWRMSVVAPTEQTTTTEEKA